jgi:hypothetical protein
MLAEIYDSCFTWVPAMVKPVCQRWQNALGSLEEGGFTCFCVENLPQFKTISFQRGAEIYNVKSPPHVPGVSRRVDGPLMHGVDATGSGMSRRLLLNLGLPQVRKGQWTRLISLQAVKGNITGSFRKGRKLG